MSEEFTEFAGDYCESCDSEEHQLLRCGTMTGWLNYCRFCWNLHLINVSHWELIVPSPE